MQRNLILSLKIGSRGSKLALVQAKWVQLELSKCGLQSEIKIIQTKGDLILDKALHKIGDKGLFTAELEKALLDQEIDLAVHCLKDLPTAINKDLPIAAITQREEPWDCIIFSSKHQKLNSLLDLPPKAKIGTSSLRRIAQLKALRSDFVFIDLRGNIDTRIKKIKESFNDLDAGVLALAGLKRLSLENQIACILNPDICLPAAGQGALAIQIAQNNSNLLLKQAIQTLHHIPTAILTGAERAALKAIEGGCQTPFAAYAQFEDENLIKVKAVFGEYNYKAELIGLATDYEQIGFTLGLKLKEMI